MGVLMFAVGTRGSDLRELQKISHDSRSAITVPDFTDLAGVQEQLQSSVEAVVVDVTPETPTDTVDTGKKDVVFLLDGSDGTRNGFPAMRDFVERVVEKLNVGPNNDRVSVVQYSRDPEVNFYLNTYTTKEDVLDSVRGLNHRGGSPLNTGAALRYVRDNVFTNSSGSRRLQGVPQMLILLNGGKSFDNVDTPASALKQQGIFVIGIGSRNSDRSELQKISHEPSYALSVPEFTDLPGVQEQLSTVLSTVRVRGTPMTPTVTAERKPPGKDVVFLLDGSDGTRRGFPAMRDFVQKAVEKLSVDDNKDRMGVLMFAVGTRGSDLRELQKISHDSRSAITVPDFTDLAGVQEQLQSSVEAVVVDVTPETPTDTVDTGKKDVVFLLDGSDGTRNGFPAMRDFVERVVEKLNVGPNNDRVSVVQYSRDPEVNFYLNTYTTKEDVVDSVRGLNHRGGSPLNTGAALRYVRDNVFTNSSGSRRLQGVPQMLILLNGGKSFDNVDTPASALKQQGIFVIGIGSRNSDRSELQKISHEPSYALSVPEFTDLPGVQEQLSTVLSTVRVRGTPMTPTVTAERKPPGKDVVFLLDGSDGTRRGFPAMRDFVQKAVEKLSVDDNKDRIGVLMFAVGTRGSDLRELQKISHDSRSAITVPDFTDLAGVQEQLQSSVEAVVVDVTPETPTDTVDTGKKDVVFLLDGSDGTRNGFPAMRDFVERVVEKLNVGPNNDRVSVVQYSRDPEVNFYLNTYTTKEDVVDSVRGLNHRGGSPLNTGAALRYVRDNVFTNSSGSRRLQGVPQMLILLNGGKSFDNVDTPASALKQQGIFVIGIGSRNSDRSELQKISHETSYALSVPEFTDLPGVQEQLSTVLSTVRVRGTPMTPTVTGKKVTDFYTPMSLQHVH
ncbi:collagen alpha-3(VI) chain-like [Acanthopagrus schlegelii]